MTALIILFASWRVFRGLGALGIAAMARLHDSARSGLAAMFVFTGFAHFTKTKYEMARMAPSVFPHPMDL